MVNKLNSFFAKLLVAGLFLLLIPMAANGAITPNVDNAITSTGNQAFEDLRRCVNTKKVLNVYYLIDESGSLQSTDPDDMRAEILANSLRELVHLSRGVQVNYAVGFFAKGFNSWKTWTKVTESNVDSEMDDLIAQVEVRDSGSATNWLLGVEGAKRELLNQAKANDGCQTMIWLTDGELYIDGKGNKEIKAYNKMCNTNMELVRQSQIVVLGVLLQSEEVLRSYSKKEREIRLANMSMMRPLVESTGVIETDDPFVQTCGTSPIPPNYAAGGLVVAKDPIGLAFQFAVIAEQIDCGVSEQLPPGGNNAIQIDPGISRVSIVTTAYDWSLKKPNGKPFNPAAGSVNDSAGVTTISIPVLANDYGQWNLQTEPNSSSAIVFCNGLSLTLDPGSLVAGVPGKVSGNIVSTTAGATVDMSVYRSSELVVQEIYADGSVSSEYIATVNPDNSFELNNFEPKPGIAQVQLRVTLRTTTASGRVLSPVSITQELVVRLPEAFPSLKDDPIKLTNLVGHVDPAKGEMTFVGSSEYDGKICIGNPRVVQDNADRDSTWEWKFTGVDSENCVAVAAGEQVTIQIEANNSQTANAHVKSEIPLTYYSDAPGSSSLPLSATAEFDSEKVSIGLAGTAGLFFLFLILGVMLPWIFNYLLMKYFTKIQTGFSGKQIQRAQYSVFITSQGLVGNQVNLNAIAPESFRLQSVTGKQRVVDTPIGQVKAKVPFWIFRRPWFELEAPAGSRVISFADTLGANTKRFTNGKFAGAPADLGRFWAVSVSEAEISKMKNKPADSQGVPATLVVFVRPNQAKPQLQQETVSKLAVQSKINSRLLEIARAIDEETASKAKPQKENKKPDGPTPPPITPGNGGATPPPRPGGGATPPPRPGGGATPPPRPGGGATPPPRPGGGATPPPRPGGGATPPPRPGGGATPPPRP